MSTFGGKPYDPVKQGFFITIDLRTGYAWGKPIVFVGRQLSGQRLAINLTTDEKLARAIDRVRSSNYRLCARQTKVVFKLNSAKELPDRIELDITLEKVEVPVYSSDWEVFGSCQHDLTADFGWWIHPAKSELSVPTC